MNISIILFDDKQQQLTNALNKEQGKILLFKDRGKIKELKNTLAALKKLKSVLNAYSLDKPMTEINEICRATLDEKSISLLNKHGDNIMIRLNNSSKATEGMIAYCQEKYPAKDIGVMIEKMSSTYNEPNWKTFFKDVVDTRGENPNLEAMQRHIAVLSQQIKEFQSPDQELDKSLHQAETAAEVIVADELKPELEQIRYSTASMFNAMAEKSGTKLTNFSKIETPLNQSTQSASNERKAPEMAAKHLEKKEEKPEVARSPRLHNK